MPQQNTGYVHFSEHPIFYHTLCPSHSVQIRLTRY